jgi:anti-anti-sigma regulatory factor
MRILTRIDPTGPVSLLLIGGFDARCVADFERTLAAVRRLGKNVHIDLSQLTAIDSPCLQYLFELASTGVASVGSLPQHLAAETNEVLDGIK